MTLIVLQCARVRVSQKAPGGGGVALLLCDSPHFQIKAHQSFGPHVLNFQMVTGQKRWFIVGCYVPLDSVAETNHIATALVHCPDTMDTILVGDINVNLFQMEGR